MRLKYLILGAGPAGLTFANKLKESGETSFLVLEKEEEAGGLCRSRDVGGFPFDIGGGHFLDVKRPLVNQYLFRFMPESEWKLYLRDSRIELSGGMVSHPIEANIWQMEILNQVAYLKSIAAAGCNTGKRMPVKFVDWIYWKLGEKIADDYMIPYNKKMFGEDLDKLGTYWLEKLPDVSFEQTLLSCLIKKACGTQPGHAQFYYPKKHGYGELWLRMADCIRNHIVYHTTITELDFDQMYVIDGCGNGYQAEKIIMTIPWTSINHFIGAPKYFVEDVKKLKHTSIQIDYDPHELYTDAQWIYYPDLHLPYHRVLVRKNFCPNSIGYWTETNLDRRNPADESSAFSYVNEYAYPLNTIEKPKIINEVLNFAGAKHVYGLGRWGEHEHFNSDVTVERALKLYEKITS